jgi:geranylgeranyl pyrophosphate synthase
MNTALSFEAHLAKAQNHIEESLSDALDELEGESAPRLLAAMRHSLLGGGKRLRAILCHWTCRGIHGSCTPASHQAALALEMIHAYSLIHDDLPAMDDDDLRRGKPSCHVAFDEATAVLAGDTLQTEAFRRLARVQPPEIGQALTALLADAAGAAGMASGQQLDLEAEGGEINPDRLVEIHRLKTGRLVGAAMAMGATAAGMGADQVDEVRRAGEDLGLAFQIVDDLLDLRSTAAVLGKTVGKDQSQAKLTAVGAWGEAEAGTRARELLRASKEQLRGLGVLHDDLASLCDLLVYRES